MIERLERIIRLRWLYASVADNRDVYSADLYTRIAATLDTSRGRIETQLEIMLSGGYGERYPAV